MERERESSERDDLGHFLKTQNNGRGRGDDEGGFSFRACFLKTSVALESSSDLFSSESNRSPRSKIISTYEREREKSFSLSLSLSFSLSLSLSRERDTRVHGSLVSRVQIVFICVVKAHERGDRLEIGNVALHDCPDLLDLVRDFVQFRIAVGLPPLDGVDLRFCFETVSRGSLLVRFGYE